MANQTIESHTDPNDTRVGEQRVKLEDLPPDVRADFLNAVHWDAWRNVFGVETKTIEQQPTPAQQPSVWKFWKW